MVNALLYDCFSGIAGDMHIGAMVDLGVPEAHLRGKLERLSLAAEFELKLERTVKMRHRPASRLHMVAASAFAA